MTIAYRCKLNHNIFCFILSLKRERLTYDWPHSRAVLWRNCKNKRAEIVDYNGTNTLSTFVRSLFYVFFWWLQTWKVYEAPLSSCCSLSVAQFLGLDILPSLWVTWSKGKIMIIVSLYVTEINWRWRPTRNHRGARQATLYNSCCLLSATLTGQTFKEGRKLLETGRLVQQLV